MDNYGEKQSIVKKVGLKKYGSTCNHVRNTTNDALIKHQVEKSDTLQGISLKYGCTMEQIRRTNRLFTTDSLFLREFLDIPVEKGSPFYPAADDSRPYRLSDHRTTTQRSLGDESAPPESIISPEEEHKKDLGELLGKIDSQLVQSKKFMAHHKDFLSEDEGDLSDYFVVDNKNPYEPEEGYQNNNSHSTASSSSSSSASHHRNLSTGGSGGSLLGTDDTVKLISKTKHVKNSLQRLERQQDELFEL